ncbi:MAG: enoyl-CoA hydratase/isomerase family protein [Rhodospirillales bacterium]|nr:enoyl-CoA hydratase/isomerase family protein [Rhodospirillales bacterium]
MQAIDRIADGAVQEIILNRPDKMNALGNSEFQALAALAVAVGQSGARAAILRGEGRAFCTGQDIASLDPSATDAERLMREGVNRAIEAVYAIPVPTIAAVQGHCVGGGFGLAFACDIVLAAEDAFFGSPFGKIGCVADSATHYHLRQRLGHHMASELIYTGRMLSGREAAERGLINAALPPDRLLAEARKMAATIAQGPTLAFRESKRILQSDAGFAATLDAEAVAQGLNIKTHDGVEGFRAFQEKRPPRFTGF